MYNKTTDENKKQIPYLPSRIGVITSPNGSVIHDIINSISEFFEDLGKAGF